MKCVYLARDVPSAELVCSALVSAGIPATVMGAELSTVSGGIPFTAAYPQVCVDEASVEEAIRVIRESGVESQPDHCIGCGYDLQGLSSLRCPECGLPFWRRTPDQSAASWACPGCGEQIEGQFDACWKCGGARPK
jgi:predicted RNA-binding Zn-ribbon protein involved in translation (DUF1610 family)